MASLVYEREIGSGDEHCHNDLFNFVKYLKAFTGLGELNR